MGERLVSGSDKKVALEILKGSGRRGAVRLIQTAAGGDPGNPAMDGEGEFRGVEWGLQTYCHARASRKNILMTLARMVSLGLIDPE